MDEDFKEYGLWLLHKVGFRHLKIRKKYKKLMEVLHEAPFESYVEHDENREADGIELRIDFINDTGIFIQTYNPPCSLLEMLVAFAIRIDDEYIGDPSQESPENIFWKMLCNLGLDQFDDRHFNEQQVKKILGVWILRVFEPDGKRSIFPLRDPRSDQRQCDLWTQMISYVNENY